ncbi:hydantoinase B/oxoprolinase family protein [Henriciella sp.]|uniref:hydantoinase B/oxoprolinase family protein n=1 Tax=Henriciella sp. TaxID=1968823 RepID=UPI002636C7A5|nr:hydantoinase B/oxoprolinase family protein [Henriciella sp.]
MSAPETPSVQDKGWQFWVDRGGTFTDVIARNPAGRFEITKLLSENPDAYDDAALAGIQRLLGVEKTAPLPTNIISDVRIGTTVATNALLERKGARTLFVVTEGFADLLAIGRQSRPDLFALDIRKPRPLYDEVCEINARVSLNGNVLRALEEEAAHTMFTNALKTGLMSCAIALINAWKHPQMELRLGEIAREAGFRSVTLSHRADPLIGLVPRAATSVTDAYLSPVLRAYVNQVSEKLGDTPLHFMQSNGGLAKAEIFQGKDAVLSGPAGGVVGSARSALALGYENVIGFDMGGTSTDISVYEGDFERVTEAEVAGTPLRVPMMDIHTVAAGGGSILRFDQGRLQVGPHSAGATPGPAAYRRGGPLTVTDANVLLGRIQPDFFPAVFGPAQDERLDTDSVETGFRTLAREIEQESGEARSPHEIALGCLSIAVANMAQAIRKVTLEKGRDTDGFVLQAFGGAGGQHACLVADELGIDTVLIHPFSGVLSALGIGLADEIDIRRGSVERALSADTAQRASTVLDGLKTAQLERFGVASETSDTIGWVSMVALRYDGTDTTIDVPFGTPSDMRVAFEARHQQQFGFITPDRALIVQSVSSELRREGAEARPDTLAERENGAPDAERSVTLWSGGESHEALIYQRENLLSGDRIEGPALIVEETQTSVIDPGWTAKVASRGDLVLTREQAAKRSTISADGKPDPVLLELFNNMFMAVAERMGAVLRDTATSVNIKERLDFSCALFDAQGRLLANAPHMPVHLGAMGESVRTVLRTRGDTLKPGDMIALNNPFNGGTHLPDVTVISPVFDETGKEIRFFVGNRGHHADIGGLTPGSTPPDAKTLEEEGVVIDDFLLRHEGDFREAAFRSVLSTAAWPARNPDANISDILAQIAANEAGARDVQAMITRYGWAGVSAYAGHVMDNAEESVRRVIDRLSDGEMHVEMDDGLPLSVSIKVDRNTRSARIDFAGTGPQRPGNFNAPPVVTRSAVLYVFRCLVADDLPLNEGCMRPLELVIPDGSFLSPSPGSAVVAGNTEVSQAVCNVLFGALGASAAAQGTMNNFLCGNDTYQYYETICGGAGAGPGHDGASGVHTHMTNTRITDPEILELRYPLRVERFALRKGSGGGGEHTGGDGVVRTITALGETTATLVSSSRTVPPFGLDGGLPGQTGQQWVDRVSGSCEALASIASVSLSAGDCITIETPGGGGYGLADRTPDRGKT